MLQSTLAVMKMRNRQPKIGFKDWLDKARMYRHFVVLIRGHLMTAMRPVVGQPGSKILFSLPYSNMTRYKQWKVMKNAFRIFVFPPPVMRYTLCSDLLTLTGMSGSNFASTTIIKIRTRSQTVFFSDRQRIYQYLLQDI